MKIIHMLKNLQKSVMLCLYKEHTFLRGREMHNFLWVIYGIYFRKTRYQTTQANDKLYERMELPTKNIRVSVEHQANTQDHDGA